MAGVPAVSVVITTHRSPPSLLDAAVRSVLQQTMDELELVVVVDEELGDPDGSLGPELEVDDRVVVVRPGRVGRARALNLGVERARSDLVAVQDADDESHP